MLRTASSKLLLSVTVPPRLQKATRDVCTEQERGEAASIYKDATTEDSVPGSSEVTSLSQKVTAQRFCHFFSSFIGVKLAYNKQNIFSMFHHDDFLFLFNFMFY